MTTNPGFLRTAFVFVCAFCLAVQAAPPGLKKRDAAQPSFTKGPGATVQLQLDVPPLTIAVPLFDQGLPPDPATWDDKGIWPQLRQAESVRIAHKVRLELEALGHFERVFVSPNIEPSADLYLMGRIDRSNGEDLNLSYDLVDATGAKWISKGRSKGRRPESDLDRPVNPGRDPFQGVYRSVALDVQGALVKKAKQHAKELARAEQRRQRGKTAKLTVLEQVTLVRDLDFAQSFAPSEYGGMLKVKGDRWQLVGMPEATSESWVYLQQMQAREGIFTHRLTEHYADFAQRMQADYELWQEDAFPAARSARLAREAAVMQGIGAVVVGVVAVKEKDKLGTVGTAAAAAGAAALAVSSFRSNEKRKAQVARLNEMGSSLNAAMASTVVEMGGREVALTGSASEQFDKWRGTLEALYRSQEDLSAVRIVT